MKVDSLRIKSHLAEIRRNSLGLNQLIDQNELEVDSVPLRAAKSILIELAEAMSGAIQHILARDRGIAVSGYIDTVVKAYESGIISQRLFERLKPFFDFHNSPVHRYWGVDDDRLIANIETGRHDFDEFIEEIEVYLGSAKDQTDPHPNRGKPRN